MGVSDVGEELATLQHGVSVPVPACNLLLELEARDFTVRHEGTTVIVEPAVFLTPEDCAAIRQWKWQLLVLLNYCARPDLDTHLFTGPSQFNVSDSHNGKENNMAENTKDNTTDDVTADLAGKFLKQAEFDDGPRVFRINSAEKKTFPAQGGRDEERKWVLHMQCGRDFGLNKTNLQFISDWLGKKPSAWSGHEVEIYNDTSVQFGGRRVGGLRVRRPARENPALAGDSHDLAREE